MKTKIINRRILIYVLINIITLGWLLFYTLVYKSNTPLFLFFTYQSNVLIWAYYSLWVLAFMLMKTFNKTKFFNFMDSYRIRHFMTTIITMTMIIAIFILGPFEATYSLINDLNIVATLTLGEVLFMMFNGTMLHLIIPGLVLYDLHKTYYDVDKVKKSTAFAPILYLTLYLVFIFLYGSITDVYPYTSLDPNAFVDWKMYFIPITSVLIVYLVSFTISDNLLKLSSAHNGGNIFNG